MRLIYLAVLLAGLSHAGNRFGGVWVANFKGTTICTLEIDDKDETLTGVSKSCRISVDQNGDLLEAEAPAPEESQPSHEFKPKVDGLSIRYELEDDDASSLKFEFRLTGEGKAELHFVNPPITIKPIRFERRP